MFFNEAIIFLNNICNFNCYHCYVLKNQQKELSLTNFDYFIDNDVSWFEIQRINLVGGEPFLYTNLIPLLKKLSTRKNLEIFITTNGSIYNEKFIKPLQSINLKLLNKLHRIFLLKLLIWKQGKENKGTPCILYYLQLFNQKESRIWRNWPTALP